MRVSIDDQGAVERFVGSLWDAGTDRARGRWREAQRILDAVASEVELLAIEVVVGPRDDSHDEIVGHTVHHFVVPDVPLGVSVARRTGGPVVQHAPERIDGAALDALSRDESVEWASLRALAVFAPTSDRELVIDRASEVRPFVRGGVLGIAGPFEIPGLGLHAPLGLCIRDDWGSTLVELERAWSSWVEEGPDLDRYRRIVAKLAALGLAPETAPEGALSPTSAAVSTGVSIAAASPASPRVVKPEYVFVASKSPGPCAECRHANQETADFAEGRLVCGRSPGARSRASICDVIVSLPRYAGEPYATWGTYYMFERYDGDNAVDAAPFNATVLAEDRAPDDRA
ncbi:MAG: hypothetical protein JNK05_29225 [Myxococcales bacterium]|nr:hypothetical protein [Myxococcales bacterium]